MSFLQKHHRILFFGSWVLLGILQAGLTELQDDEAYYWVYSKYPDWGYFDHPPLIAILIKTGYSLIPNELGVRLFPFLLHILTIFILDNLAGKKNPRLFYTMALSFAILQLSGFLAVPDTALIFSTALFFLCYKKFVLSENFSSAILLGLASALLLYSKYHGGLVILFTIISNPGLLKNYRVYTAGILAFLLFLPHLWWQYDHDWVSFRYHLFESNVNDYEAGFTLSYLAGQFLLAGPIAGLILIPAAILYRPFDKYERALRFTLIGIYTFFLLSTFRGKVEMNWTAPVLIPLFILSFQYLNARPKWFSALYKTLPVSILIVLSARVVMIADILPLKTIQQRYHAWKEWPAEMKRLTEGMPVVFSNSYQRASKYWFYSGQTTYSQNLYKEHRNQYNFWPIEDSLLGREIYYLDIYDLQRFPDSLKTPLGWIGYRRDSSFGSFSKIQIIPGIKNITAGPSDIVLLDAYPSIPESYRRYLNSHATQNAKLMLAVFHKKGWLKDWETGMAVRDLAAGKFTIKIFPQLPKGKYELMFAIAVEGYHPTHNGPRFSLTVE